MKAGLLCLAAVLLLLCVTVSLASTPRDAPEGEAPVFNGDPEAPQVDESPEVPPVSESPANNQERPQDDPEKPHEDDPVQESPEAPSPSYSPSPSSAPLPSSAPTNSESSADTPVCTMIAVECPDGSYATSNLQCDIICGAAPIGGLDYESVDAIRAQLVKSYPSEKILSTYVHTMAGKEDEVVLQTPPESYSDFCIEATLRDDDFSVMPDVFNGVRVFYSREQQPDCSPIICDDGSMVGCNDVCPESASNMFMPVTIILAVVTLSTCCCCLRRRCRKQRCASRCNTTAIKPQQATEISIPQEYYYPAENYEHMAHQGEFDPRVPLVSPYMAYPPPMAPIPPHMMNGQVPFMVQGSDGMWYLIPQDDQQ